MNNFHAFKIALKMCEVLALLTCVLTAAVDGAIRCLSLLADDLAEEQIIQVSPRTSCSPADALLMHSVIMQHTKQTLHSIKGRMSCTWMPQLMTVLLFGFLCDVCAR